jgi:hypothetical protein
VANFFDQFDEQQTQAPAQPAAANYFDQFDEAKPSVAEDVVKSAASGIPEGLALRAQYVPQLMALGAKKLTELAAPAFEPGGSLSWLAPGGSGLQQAQANQQAVAQATASLPSFNYEPQTPLGGYAKTGTTFLAGGVGSPGATTARGIVANVLLPAAASEAAGQATAGSPYEPIARAIGGIGAAGLTGAASALPRALAVSPERAAMVQTLANEGIQVPAGMALGNRPLSAAESQLGGGTYGAAVENMNRQFTQATLRRAGIDAEAATPDVINKAAKDIGQQFDDVAARNPSIPIGDFAQKAATVANDFKDLTGAESPLLSKLVSRIGDTGNISGETYQSVQSDIQRFARASSSPELRNALYDLKGELDSAIQNGLKDSADAQVWKQARNDWKNLLVVQKAVSGTTEAQASGLITPAALTRANESVSRGSYARGRGDFTDLARAGNAIMKAYQDSGTASRLGIVARLAALGGGLAAGGIPGLATAGVGVAAPYFAGKALLAGPIQRAIVAQAIRPGPTARAAFAPSLLPAAIAIGAANRNRQLGRF